MVTMMFGVKDIKIDQRPMKDASGATVITITDHHGEHTLEMYSAQPLKLDTQLSRQILQIWLAMKPGKERNAVKKILE